MQKKRKKESTSDQDTHHNIKRAQQIDRCQFKEEKRLFCSASSFQWQFQSQQRKKVDSDWSFSDSRQKKIKMRLINFKLGDFFVD